MYPAARVRAGVGVRAGAGVGVRAGAGVRAGVGVRAGAGVRAMIAPVMVPPPQRPNRQSGW